MEELFEHIRRARRRLEVQRFAGVLGWCWFATFSAVLGLVILGRFYPLPLTDVGYGLVASGLGLGVALGWMAATRRGSLHAALEIDRRFALKERVSSTLAMPPEDRDTAAGRALAEDAVRRLRRLDLAERFDVAPPRRFLLPLVPGVLALLAAVLFEPAVLAEPEPTAEEQAREAADRESVSRVAKVLPHRLADPRQQAADRGFMETEELLRRVEDGSRELSREGIDRRRAMAKLNDLARQLQQRRQELGGAEKIREQLNRLKDVDQGPAEQLAKALSRGDYDLAAEKIEEMINRLADGDLTDPEKAKLAEQLQQIKEKLDDLASAHEDAQDDLKQRADRSREEGNTGEADRLLGQLDQLLKEPQLDQLEDLAEQLGQCCEQLGGDRPGDAAKTLRDLQAGLENLQRQLDETELLDQAMDQLTQARDQMNCRQCGGAGCQACEGEQPGTDMGMGTGSGEGRRAEAVSDVGLYDSAVKQKVGEEGVSVFAGMADGPNRKGVAEEIIKQQYDEVRHGDTDPLTEIPIPRNIREHARQYFDRMRRGDSAPSP